RRELRLIAEHSWTPRLDRRHPGFRQPVRGIACALRGRPRPEVLVELVMMGVATLSGVEARAGSPRRLAERLAQREPLVVGGHRQRQPLLRLALGALARVQALRRA